MVTLRTTSAWQATCFMPNSQLLTDAIEVTIAMIVTVVTNSGT
jgi:hypothetical protein